MRTSHVFKHGFLLLLMLLALRCGGDTREYARALSERAHGRLSRAPAAYVPATLDSDMTAEKKALRATFEAALEPQARARLRHDPALDLAAEVEAENFSDQGMGASPSLFQWLFWKSGSLAVYRAHQGGYVRRGSRGGGGPDKGTLEAWARKAAEQVNASPTGFLSYGLGRFSEGKVTSQAIVFGQTDFDVASFSKTHAPGGALTLTLRSRVPHRELRFLVDQGDRVTQQILTPRPDGSFFVSQVLPTKPGRYFIEVQGPGPQRATLLMVPVYVGVPETPAPDEFIQHPPPGPPDLAGWSAWTAAVYNGERAKLGKPPLVVDARLTAIATERSAIKALGRHAEPIDSRSFRARLKATSFAAQDFEESIVDGNATDVVFLRLLQPSARSRLLLPDRVLFGAAAAPHPPKEGAVPGFTLVEETVARDAAAQQESPP